MIILRKLVYFVVFSKITSVVTDSDQSLSSSCESIMDYSGEQQQVSCDYLEINSEFLAVDYNTLVTITDAPTPKAPTKTLRPTKRTPATVEPTSVAPTPLPTTDTPTTKTRRTSAPTGVPNSPSTAPLFTPTFQTTLTPTAQPTAAPISNMDWIAAVGVGAPLALLILRRLLILYKAMRAKNKPPEDIILEFTAPNNTLDRT